MEKFIHLIKELVDITDSKGAERIICLVLMHTGVMLLLHGMDYGKDIAEGAFGALLLSMRSDRTANGVKKENGNATQAGA